jgi:hypothetical protein
MNPAADTYPLRANPAATTNATAAIHPAGPNRPVRNRSHSQAIVQPASIIRIAKLAALQTNDKMVTGASTSADANRSFRLSAAPSVGPQGVDEDQFGVGKLP